MAITKGDAEKIVIERDASTEGLFSKKSIGDVKEDGTDSEADNSGDSDSKELELRNKGSYREPPEDVSYIKYTIKVHRD